MKVCLKSAPDALREEWKEHPISESLDMDNSDELAHGKQWCSIQWSLWILLDIVLCIASTG
ncbi:MAG: hypothetical protein MUO43_01125 [Desulfobacterales bacterium]|nr:hypothetical protein [Desulfobacterales bacterium]